MEPATTAQVFLECARQFLSGEYRIKLRLAVLALPADAVWGRANDQSNSVGNLLLHLNGNVRQWILSSVGGAPNDRNRAAEFSAQTGPSAAELLAMIDETLDQADRVLAAQTPSALLERRTIQGRDVTVLDAIFHVTEHFSGHLGQIILIAKLRSPGAIQFYEDAGGLAKPTWDEKVARTP